MRTVLPIVYASVVGLLLACSDSTGPSESSIKAPSKIPTYPAGAFQVSPATATVQNGQTFRSTTTYSGNLAGTGRAQPAGTGAHFFTTKTLVSTESSSRNTTTL